VSLDLLDHQAAVVDAPGASGALSSPLEVAEAVRRLPPDATFRLGASEPLDGPRAAAIFRALLGTGRRFQARLTTSAVCHKAAIDEAARAGCVAIEVEREGPLVDGLASGNAPETDEIRRLVVALRRARGLGVATIARLHLGLPGDDEGSFDRVLRFARRALVSLPLVETASEAAEPADGDAVVRMDRATLENGIGWLRARLVRHATIWRRALWPTGSAAVTLRAGYDLRRRTQSAQAGRYTPTMDLLRRLNRTKRARSAAHMLAAQLAEAAAAPAEAARRGWLRTHAWSDSHIGALFIRVEGTLDVRGARRLLRRVRQASEAGFRRVTIDFGGLEWVAPDVVTHFLEENRTRFRELAQSTRIVNLASVVESLRRQLGDCEGLRLLEQAR